MPLLPETIETQPRVLLVLQAHPLCVVTLIFPVNPDALGATLVGLVAYVQDAVPCCVTVNDWPAAVMVPVLALPLFGDTTYPTVPFPLPLPETMEIQLALLEAVHAQPLADVTEMPPDPPAVVAAALDGFIPYVQVLLP